MFTDVVQETLAPLATAHKAYEDATAQEHAYGESMSLLRAEQRQRQEELASARRMSGLATTREEVRRAHASEQALLQTLLTLENTRARLQAQRTAAGTRTIQLGDAYRELAHEASVLWHTARLAHQNATDTSLSCLEQVEGEETRDVALLKLASIAGETDAETVLRGERPPWLQSR